MNENQLIDLMNEIANETGSKLTTSDDSAPLVSSTIYDIDSEGLRLHVKIAKAAAMSALNKNMTLNFYFSNQAFKPFSIIKRKSLLSFLSDKVRYRVSGNKNQEVVQFLETELKREYLAGVRLLKIEYDADTLSVEFKTLYLESLKSILQVLLKLVKR